MNYEYRDPAEGRHRSLGLTQNHPLARQQSSLSQALICPDSKDGSIFCPAGC